MAQKSEGVSIRASAAGLALFDAPRARTDDRIFEQFGGTAFGDGELTELRFVAKVTPSRFRYILKFLS